MNEHVLGPSNNEFNMLKLKVTRSNFDYYMY